MITKKIEEVKKGEYFRRLKGKAVLVRSDYNRSSKKYMNYRFDDINHQVDIKKGTFVEVDFDF